jgi:integrase
MTSVCHTFYFSDSSLDSLYKTMLSKPLSTRVVRYVHTLVHGMLKQAVKWGKLPRNVAEAATPPSLITKQMKVWTPKDAVRFLEFTALDRLRAAWYLALFAGLRRAELLGLRWEDVNLETAELSVNQGLVEVKTKGSKSRLELSAPKTLAGRRTISISADTVGILQAHLEQQSKEREQCGDHWQETGLVFTSSLGTPVNPRNLARSYKRLIRLAKVPDIRLHDLRHISASLAVARGDSPKVVSERLGHTNVAFTLNTYVKTFANQRREAALGMADLFPRVEGVAPN